MRTYDDYELVKQSMQGNQDAFAQLVNQYKNLVYSVILRMVNDSEEANDLAQEVFIKVYKNLDKYQPEYKFSTWIIRITTNHVIDYRRRKKQETVNIDDLVYEPADGITPEDEYVRKETQKGLAQTIENLPDIYKIPIVLYHQQGLRYQEISDILGEPLSKIKNRIFRGRKMLRESLENKAGDSK
ncbi:MAG: sigma-70 family RNA polymerase sigma factor [Epulopiscium sp.]|nr:sigma-70 family RNA polymerase sigma factor [Candidatus Epulonipiscium sp.]